MKTETRNWVIAAALALLAVAIAVVVPSRLLQAVDPALQRTASIVLPAMITGGVLAIICALAIVALAFAAANMSDRSQALGLPEGTVRAVIALSLIFIFLIAALYLYADLRAHGLGEIYTTTGLSQEMAEAWLISQADDIVSISMREGAGESVYDVVRKDGDKNVSLPGLSQEEFEAELSKEGVFVSIAVREEAAEKSYDIQQSVGQSKASEDLAKQIITTVSTLVVAIASFYFGTRSVATARGEAVHALPVIIGIDPDVGERGKKIEKVKISGENFDGPVEVKLVKGMSTVLATDPPCSSKEIICTFDLTDKPLGKWDLIVVNQDGGENRRHEAFTVTAVPTADSIDPSTGKIGDKVEVAIAGKDFIDGAQVELRSGDVKIPGTPPTVESDKKIVCIFDLTAATAGTWDVVVINPGSQEGKKPQAFTVTEQSPEE